MTTCDCCGMEILAAEITRRCPSCERLMCVNCDAGAGTVCSGCEYGSEEVE